jgi:hypothetical protein
MVGRGGSNARPLPCQVAAETQLLGQQMKLRIQTGAHPWVARLRNSGEGPEVFQTVTNDCHLKHPAIHQSTALVVLTMIRLLAYALSWVFLHRAPLSDVSAVASNTTCAKSAAWQVADSPLRNR